VHLARHSLNFCVWKDGDAMASNLSQMYGVATADQAVAELDVFAGKMSREICLNRSGMTAGVAAGDPIPCLQSGHPKDHLHHQCPPLVPASMHERGNDREPEPSHSQVYPAARFIPHRGGEREGDLSRDP
jgi:hypothetical protein